MAMLNVDLLREVLAVPTATGCEHLLVDFLGRHARQRGYRFSRDAYNNVCIEKGSLDCVPCVSAHIDTVHAFDPTQTQVHVYEVDGTLIAKDGEGVQTGIGGDDKAGVSICLELLERFSDIKAIFFASEEIGCAGAYKAPATWFDNVGYLLEFDAPSTGLVSYKTGGVRLFENGSEFVLKALPVLKKWNFTKWQNHPYTDVKAVRQRFSFACFNFSCGYYHWHTVREYVKLADVAISIQMATELIAVLGQRRYLVLHLNGEPDLPVTGLIY